MKYLKYFLIGIIVIVGLFVLVLRIGYHEPRPSIIEDESAEILAQKMLNAVNKAAWDTLPLISWSFRGAHHFAWDKVRNKALVQWDDYTVHLDPDQVTGIAYQGENVIPEEKSKKIIQKAWSHWCNDMFWLAAPFKIRDPGTSLSVAQDKDGNLGLLVTYESGGVTPGDSYLWFLDNEGLPTGYKMWVSIIPIVGGVYTSWQDWITLPGGSKIASNHQGNLEALKIDITNVKAGSDWGELGFEKSPIQL